MLFTKLPLCDTLLEGLQAMNFRETTPVQEQAIPVILEKKDVIACAQTGTGKTAAFLLPLLNNLQTDAHNENKINAIVMAPTRELAQQIDQQMEGFSYFTPFSSVAVYGGNDGDAWDVQKRGLLSGADVVIATPGRLLSHINLYNIDFSGVKYFILDEADRMLDMGFHDDIMKIEKLLPKERQTVMFSATMPPKIQQLAKSILRNPVDISIAISRPPETILQSAYICHESQKINIVTHLFKEKAPNKVILFSGSKQKVKEIAKTLRHLGLSAGEMHSDLDQSQRNHVMHEFKNERVNILVATDIVARGIDIDDITLVINFDVPHDAEDYVHRIGRTARAGDSGMAITFVSPDEQYRFSRIEQFLGKQIYRIPVPLELGETPEYNPSRDTRRGRVPVRASKGGRRDKEASIKGGKPSSGRPDRPEDSGNREKTERPRESQRNRAPRPERNLQANGATRSESSSRKNEVSSRPERSSQQNRTSPPSRSERNPNPREGQGQRQAPRKQITLKKQRTSQESTSPVTNTTPRKRQPITENSPYPKKTVPPQSANTAAEQTVKTDKPKKKWKWWPF
jgi:superfamily II DNA/RNA helicase